MGNTPQVVWPGYNQALDSNDLEIHLVISFLPKSVLSEPQLIIFLGYIPNASVLNTGKGGAFKHPLWNNFLLMSFNRLIIIGKLYNIIINRINFSLSCSYKGIVKKQSLKSISIRDHPSGNKEDKGNPDCKGLIGWIIFFMALKSVNTLHLPDLFLITNIEELKGLINSSICWASVWSCMNSYSVCNFSEGHCTTYTGCQLTILRVKMLTLLKDHQLLCLDALWMFLKILFNISHKSFFILCFFLRLEEC